MVLVMGGFYVVSKVQPAQRPSRQQPGRVAVSAASGSHPGSTATDLLEAMKEELFQLEIDRQQGKISAEEYAKAKAALDETIKRALARSVSE